MWSKKICCKENKHTKYRGLFLMKITFAVIRILNSKFTSQSTRFCTMYTKSIFLFYFHTYICIHTGNLNIKMCISKLYDNILNTLAAYCSIQKNVYFEVDRPRRVKLHVFSTHINKTFFYHQYACLYV